MASLKERMAQKKAQIAEQSGRRQQTVKPAAGASRWRILPSWRGEGEDFFHDFGQHFVKDAQGKTAAVYVCAEKTFQRPCPVCEAIREGIGEAKDDATKKLLGDAKASGRILLNALDVAKSLTDPVILELSPTTFDKLIDIYQQNPDEENDDFNIVTDLNDGVDIIITRSGTGLNTEYSVQPALKGSKKVDPKVLEKLNNLDEYVAQEQELGLLKATNAVKATLTGTKALSKPSSKGEEFDDDVPNYPSTGGEEIIEGDYKSVSDEKMSDDELNALLDEIE